MILEQPRLHRETCFKKKKERKRKTETEKGTYIHTYRQKERKRKIETEKGTDIHTYRQVKKERKEGRKEGRRKRKTNDLNTIKHPIDLDRFRQSTTCAQHLALTSYN